MSARPMPARALVSRRWPVMLALGLFQLGACAAVTRQVDVPEILAPPPAPAQRSAAMPVAEAEIVPVAAPAPVAKPEPIPVAAAAPAPVAAPAAVVRETTFVDRFETLNLQRWYPHNRGPNGSWISNGFRPSQVKLTREGVQLTMQKDVRASEGYSSGEIAATVGRTSGYVEARVKAAEGSGMNTSVFTYAAAKGKTIGNEIDFEILGRDPGMIELTLHAAGKSVNKKHRLGFDASKGFHTYGIEWRKGLVRWYVDNKMVFEVKGGLADRMTREQGFHLSLWGSNTLATWMGQLDLDRTTWTAVVSCAAMADSYKGRSLCDDAPNPLPASMTAETPKPVETVSAPPPAPSPAISAAPRPQPSQSVETVRAPVAEPRKATTETRRSATGSKELRAGAPASIPAVVPAEAAPQPSPTPVAEPVAAPALKAPATIAAPVAPSLKKKAEKPAAPPAPVVAAETQAAPADEPAGGEEELAGGPPRR